MPTSNHHTPVTIKKGVSLGIGLWVLIEIIVLPFLGWGLFGTAITPAIAVTTLILHLLYGTILGWGLDRNVSFSTDEATPPYNNRISGRGKCR